jgi:hypothetical protein
MPTVSRRTVVLTALLLMPAASVIAGPDDPPENPFLEYAEPQNWTWRVQVDVTAYERSDKFGFEVQAWNFDTLALIFPLMRETGASVADPRDARGELRVGDRVYSAEFKLIDGYHSDAAYGRWDAAGLVGVRDISLVYEARARAWETTLNEQAASRIGWPQGDWPTEARGTFEPQFGVEFAARGEPTTRAIDERLKQWTDGKDPKSIPPLTLAKYLAGRVLEGVQPVGDGLQQGRSRTRRGFEGFRLQGADRTVQSGRGSPFDMVAALAGVYRRAGLPARVVIGLREYDEYDTTDVTQEKDLDGESGLHAIVEFFLFDEKTGEQGWIPVDILQMRKQSSRARPLEQPWPYFGTHPELDHFIPIAMHFHPPTTVRAYGSAGLWGWFVTPEPPATAFQQLTFSSFNTPVRGGEPAKPRSD